MPRVGSCSRYAMSFPQALTDPVHQWNVIAACKPLGKHPLRLPTFCYIRRAHCLRPHPLSHSILEPLFLSLFCNLTSTSQTPFLPTMKTNALFAVASAALAAAAPSRGKGPSRNCASKSELATFDNLPTLPAAAELSPVGNYDGLTYNSLDVLNAGVAGIIVTGLVPQSGSNVAVNGLTNELTSGNPSLTPVAPYKSLTLESLYFGCVVNTASSVTGVPEACTLAITAYEPGSVGRPLSSMPISHRDGVQQIFAYRIKTPADIPHLL